MTTYRLFCARVVIGSAFMLFIILAAVIYGCAGWTINGIPTDDLRRADAGELAKMGAGMLSSMVVHAAGHIVYLEAVGKPWHMEGLAEIADGRLSHDQRRWFGRIGFVSQLAGGALLKAAEADRHFTAGYCMGTAAEIWSYPVLHASGESDIRMIDSGDGSGGAEWAAYSVGAGLLLFGKQ